MAWLDNPRLTGAVSPSGPALARAMAAHVDPAELGLVVELGPGTGPVTEALLARGVAESRLVLVEFDPAFCALLAARFPQARIVQGDAYDLPRALGSITDEPIAVIVSSLPLLTKPEASRVVLLADAFARLAPGGRFVQFTYGVASPVPRGARALGLAFHAEASAPVWLNLPPARVWVYRPKPAAVVEGSRLRLLTRLIHRQARLRRAWSLRTARVLLNLTLVRADLDRRGARIRARLSPAPVYGKARVRRPRA